MTDTLVSALTEHLTAAGLRAVQAYPRDALRRKESCVCVGIQSCKAAGGAMGEYLGRRTPAGGGDETELYGLRLEVEFALTVLAPDAGQCTRMLDAVSAALATLPSGLKAQGLVCAQVLPDRTAGMFRCDTQLFALAYLVAQADEESQTFLDFELRGVLKHAHS